MEKVLEAAVWFNDKDMPQVPHKGYSPIMHLRKILKSNPEAAATFNAATTAANNARRP
jgi:hypothetical protein